MSETGHCFQANGILECDKVSLILYGLSYHYIGGRTFFKGIAQGQLPSFPNITTSDGGSNINGIDTSQLLRRRIDPDIEIADVTKALVLSVEKSLNASQANKVSLSLTGGFDSRILLSILKKLGVDIHCYTYGDPEARDCVIAREIAGNLRVPHTIHSVTYNASTFSTAAQESIRLGDSICSLHRAHRVEAIKRESEYADVMLLGTMGGEFVKGANHDDYIVSDFVYDYAKTNTLETIDKHLKIRCIKVTEDLILEAKRILDDQHYIKDRENMELHALVEIAAGLHHGQNLIQYTKFFPYVFSPYSDLDYLKVLFSSRYNFLQRRRQQTSAKYKLENPRFGCLMQRFLNRSMAKIPYASGFSADEYLASPYYAAVKAKYRRHKQINPPTFPLGNWMAEFVREQLRSMLDSGSFVCNYFDVSQMLSELERKDLPQTEAFWLKYTCPVQMYLTQKIYGVEQ